MKEFGQGNWESRNLHWFNGYFTKEYIMNVKDLSNEKEAGVCAPDGFVVAAVLRVTASGEPSNCVLALCL
ncbi:MAG TPA: hypothetical protein DDY17_04320 [Syntrophaceae bacterium]|jgi:hypothetical protein|nr:hypothetical protein [Syntrophaceae bacterium]